MNEDKIATVEAAYQVVFTARERTLLTTPKALLSNPEQQEACILRMDLTPIACPSCGLGICKYIAREEEGGSCPDDMHRCPRCQVPLIWYLGITGQQWFTVNFEKQAQEQR